MVFPRGAETSTSPQLQEITEWLEQHHLGDVAQGLFACGFTDADGIQDAAALEVAELSKVANVSVAMAAKFKRVVKELP